MKRFLKELIYRFRGNVTIDSLKKMGLSVGENFSAQTGYNLDPSHCWLITIGDDVTLAPHVQILAHDASTCKYLGYAKIGRVDIGNRVFIGAGSIILPGVTVGDNVIIGAGSVVSHSLSGNAVYAGNPARYICSIDDYVNKHKRQMLLRPVYSEEYTLRKNISHQMKQEQSEALKDGIGYVE